MITLICLYSHTNTSPFLFTLRIRGDIRAWALSMDWKGGYKSMDIDNKHMARLLNRYLAAARVQAMDIEGIYTDLLMYRIKKILGLFFFSDSSVYFKVEQGLVITEADVLGMAPCIRHLDLIPLQEGYSYYNRGYRGTRYIVAFKEHEEASAAIKKMSKRSSDNGKENDADEMNKWRLKAWKVTVKQCYTEILEYKKELKELDAQTHKDFGAGKVAGTKILEKLVEKMELELPVKSEESVKGRVLECLRYFELAEDCFRTALDRNPSSSTIVSYSAMAYFIRAKLEHILGREKAMEDLLKAAIDVFQSISSDSTNNSYILSQIYSVYCWWCLHTEDTAKASELFRKAEGYKEKAEIFKNNWFFCGELTSVTKRIINNAHKNNNTRVCLFRTSCTTVGVFTLTISLKPGSTPTNYPVLTDHNGRYFIQFSGKIKTFDSIQDIIDYLKSKSFYICTIKHDHL